MALRVVHVWRDDGGCHEADDDQERSGYPGVVLAEAVGLEDLVYERGGCVEESDVHGEGE